MCEDNGEIEEEAEGYCSWPVSRALTLFNGYIVLF